MGRMATAPSSEALGTPQGGKGYVATRPTCGPPLILPPALKHWARGAESRRTPPMEQFVGGVTS